MSHFEGAGNPLAPLPGQPPVIVSGIKHHAPEAEAPPVQAVNDAGRVDPPVMAPAPAVVVEEAPAKKKAAPRAKKAKNTAK